jgi:cell wall-associated NlpC family hydrolase
MDHLTGKITMPLLDLDKLTADLAGTWAGYLRDWDRSLHSGNYPETTRHNYLLAAAQLARYLADHSPDPEAEQAVQRSAFPGRYAPQEAPAQTVVGKFWNGPDNPSPAMGQLAGSTTGTPRKPAYTISGGCPDQGGSNLAVDPQTLPAGYQLPSDQVEAAAVSYALAQLGKPYVWGAKGPNAFDCSGLMQAAWANAGVAIGAGTTSQVHNGSPVTSLTETQPGDLSVSPHPTGKRLRGECPTRDIQPTCARGSIP